MLVPSLPMKLFPSGNQKPQLSSNPVPISRPASVSNSMMLPTSFSNTWHVVSVMSSGSVGCDDGRTEIRPAIG